MKLKKKRIMTQYTFDFIKIHNLKYVFSRYLKKKYLKNKNSYFKTFY